jgi:quercetin dioxygenase-like cupin family protein
MYNSHHEIVYNQIVEGVKIKVTQKDETMQMTEFELRKGAILPEHVHRSNHSAYLLYGKIRIVVNNKERTFIKGDSWCLGKNICHYTEALEDSLVIEVYSSEEEISAPGGKIHEPAI